MEWITSFWRRTPSSWDEVCGVGSQSPHKIALYTLCSSIISDIIYNGDSPVPLTKHEFKHKLQSEAERNNFFRPISFALSISNHQEETVFVVVDFSDFRILGIRGSVTDHDWDCNFSTEEVIAEYHSVHLGFAKRAKSVPSRLIYEFGDRVRCKPTVFCGHSQGGAAANICALPLISRGLEVYSITFGAPSFIKSNPLPPHSAHMQNRFLRFAMSGDVVPTITHGKGYSVFERYVTLSKSGAEVAAVVGPPDWVGHIPSLSAQANHSMTLYRECISLLCGFISQNVAPSEIIEVTDTNLDMLVLPNSIKMKCRVYDNRVLMDIEGEGVNCGVIAAAKSVALADGNADKSTEQTAVATSFQYVRFNPQSVVCDDGHVEACGCVCRFSATFDETAITRTGSSIMSCASGLDDTVLLLSNGFDTIEVQCRFSSGDNVAIIGDKGHGKSHLVDALELHTKDPSAVLEEYSSGVTRAADDEAHSFRYQDIIVYETPGLSITTPDYISALANVFAKYPPKLIVLTFDCDGKTDNSAGLAQLIARLKAVNGSNNLPPMILAMPKAFRLNKIALEARARSVLTALDLDPTCVPYYPVNSARTVPDCDGHVKEPFGVPELWKAIVNGVRDSSVVNPIKVQTKLESLYSFLLSVAGGLTVGGFVAFVGSVVVVAVRIRR